MTRETLKAMKNLTEQERMYVLTANKKDTGVAYLCWFFFGVHYFYLNKPLTNIIYWLTLGGLGIWAIIDLFRIPTMVQARNAENIQDAVNEAKFIYSDTVDEIEETAKEHQTDWVNIFAWILILFVMCKLCDGGFGFVITLILWVIDRYTNIISDIIGSRK